MMHRLAPKVILKQFEQRRLTENVLIADDRDLIIMNELAGRKGGRAEHRNRRDQQKKVKS
jgi:hypothetical protein